jgi:hypothetical protein
MARRHAREALQTIVALMRDKGGKLEVRLRAAATILEWGFGRPGPMPDEQSDAPAGAELVELFRRPPPPLDVEQGPR